MRTARVLEVLGVQGVTVGSCGTRTISTVCTVSTFSTSEGEDKGLFEGVGHPAQEARRVRAVDHPVIV